MPPLSSCSRTPRHCSMVSKLTSCLRELLADKHFGRGEGHSSCLSLTTMVALTVDFGRGPRPSTFHHTYRGCFGIVTGWYRDPELTVVESCMRACTWLHPVAAELCAAVSFFSLFIIVFYLTSLLFFSMFAFKKNDNGKRGFVKGCYRGQGGLRRQMGGRAMLHGKPRGSRQQPGEGPGVSRRGGASAPCLGSLLGTRSIIQKAGVLP